MSDDDSPPSYSAVVSPSPIDFRPFVSLNAPIITIPVSESIPDLEPLENTAVSLDTEETCGFSFLYEHTISEKCGQGCHIIVLLGPDLSEKMLALGKVKELLQEDIKKMNSFSTFFLETDFS